jgi:translin
VPELVALEQVVHDIVGRMAARNAARETGLSECRRIIRLSANAIRAIHRDDRPQARELLAEAHTAHEAATMAMSTFPDIRFAGFLHDAQKEYAEAATTVAILTGEALPSPASLGVEDAAYLNGISEVIGELRRVLLDRLRAGRIEDCDGLLQAMDDIYSVLVTVDFPDAMTGGLRRSTDQARAILERTRGDLTMAVVISKAAGYVAEALPADE